MCITRGGGQSGAQSTAYLPCHVLGAPARALGSVAVAVARKGLAPYALRLRPEQTEVGDGQEHDCDHAGVGGEDDVERAAPHRCAGCGASARLRRASPRARGYSSLAKKTPCHELYKKTRTDEKKTYIFPG